MSENLPPPPVEETYWFRKVPCHVATFDVPAETIEVFVPIIPGESGAACARRLHEALKAEVARRTPRFVAWRKEIP